jgi:hypothetical protein
MSTSFTKDTGFKQWIVDLKVRIRQSQIKAAIKVNDELLRLYWDLGHDIVVRQMDAVWGSRFFEQLSKELKAEFPDMQGFSVTNLKRCKYFYQFYSQNLQIRSQVGNELQIGENKGNIIRPQVGDELENEKFHQLGEKLENEILHQVGAEMQQSENKESINRHQVGDDLENNMLFLIPWRHHVEIFTKCKSVHEALF